MAERFVVSGATMYQSILLRHFADIASYPADAKVFIENNWVRVLKDGKVVGLSEDEFHERTASLDLQLIVPRQQTKRNMEVVVHYLPFSAHMQRNCKSSMIGKKPKVRETRKACSKSFVEKQESFLVTFYNKFAECDPFGTKHRPLFIPFTQDLAKKNVRDDMLNAEEIGREVLLAYVKPRYCSPHDVTTEIQPMKRIRLALFKPPSRESKKAKQTAIQKEVMEVLAAHAVKGGSSPSLVGSQMCDLPLAFCNPDGTPFMRSDKTGVRKWIEDRYPSVILSRVTVPKEGSIYIRDGMQDIMMAPKSYCWVF